MKTKIFFIMFIICAFQVYSDGINKIAVLDFNTSGVSENEMLLFTDYIATRISRSPDYILIDRRQRNNILEELSFSNSGCTDEDCQLEIGRILSANIIVVGSIGSIGSVYLLNMHIVNVETSVTLKTVSDQYDSLDQLVRDSDNLVNQLLSEGPETPGEDRNDTTIRAKRPYSGLPSKDAGAEGTGSDNRDSEDSGIDSNSDSGGLTGELITNGTDFWKGAWYLDGNRYFYPKDFDILGEKLVADINTPAAANLFENYKADQKSGDNLMWGATACAAGGLLLIMTAVNSDSGSSSSDLSAGAVGGLVLDAGGLVLMLISSSRRTRARTSFNELVDQYNFGLN